MSAMMEEITAVELNRIEKQVLAAEIDPKKVVTLDARTARALVEAYKDGGGLAEELASETERADDAESELDEARDQIRDLERQLEKATAK